MKELKTNMLILFKNDRFLTKGYNQKLIKPVDKFLMKVQFDFKLYQKKQLKSQRS